jgi:hypothetical protein
VLLLLLLFLPLLLVVAVVWLRMLLRPVHSLHRGRQPEQGRQRQSSITNLLRLVLPLVLARPLKLLQLLFLLLPFASPPAPILMYLQYLYAEATKRRPEERGKGELRQTAPNFIVRSSQLKFSPAWQQFKYLSALLHHPTKSNLKTKR